MTTSTTAGEPDSGVREGLLSTLGQPRPERRERARKRAQPRVASADYRALLLEHLPFIERKVRAVARRHALSPCDADDLDGQVKLRMVANDYAILRKFQGKSRLTTYLTPVIQNIFRDFRIQRWGKWRPSAAARRMGDVGVQLETLISRDGFELHEAVEILRERFAAGISDRALERMAAELPRRTTRRFASDAGLERLEARERGDCKVVESARSAARHRVEQVLRGVLDSLDDEERIILRMRFAEGFTFREIARTLGMDERRIYSRARRLLNEVRQRVEAGGVACDDVLELLDEPQVELVAGLAQNAEDPAAPP